MRIEVRYYSKNGGTKKLAESIAKAVNAEAKTVDTPLDKYADVVFLGSSVYGGKPDPAVVKFSAAKPSWNTAVRVCAPGFSFFR